MDDKKPQECVFDYLKKSLDKRFDEMKKEHDFEGIPNTHENQEKLKDMAKNILKGEW